MKEVLIKFFYSVAFLVLLYCIRILVFYLLGMFWGFGINSEKALVRSLLFTDIFLVILFLFMIPKIRKSSTIKVMFAIGGGLIILFDILSI